MAGKKPTTPQKTRIKTGDLVQIIAGKDKGRQGKVLRVLPMSGKVVVEGLNIMVRHTKGQPTQNNPNPESGRLERPAPILASKVMLVDSDGNPTRIRMGTDDKGNKVRLSAKNGKVISAG